MCVSVCIYSYLILPWNEILHGEKSTDRLSEKESQKSLSYSETRSCSSQVKTFLHLHFCHPSNTSRVQNTLKNPLAFWTFCFWKVTLLHCSYFFCFTACVRHHRKKRWPRRNLLYSELTLKWIWVCCQVFMSVCGQIFVTMQVAVTTFYRLEIKMKAEVHPGPSLIPSSISKAMKRSNLHPSIHCRTLNQGRVVVAAGSVGYSRCPSMLSSSSWGGSWGVPGPDEIHNPTSGFWFCPGVSSQLVVPGKPPKGGSPSRRPNRMLEPHELAPFLQQQIYSELKHPPEENHFWLLVPEILFFRSLTMPVERPHFKKSF